MTDSIIDRRQNPKGKSLSNRQRFLTRSRGGVKEAVARAIRGRRVAETGSGEKISIPTGGIEEPTFDHDHQTGRGHRVFPGNDEYLPGHTIPRPQDGGGGGGREGSPDGSGEDAFEFMLSKEEFLELFFEDLELPDLVKKSLADTKTFDAQRAGYMIDGPPAQLHILRTMRQAMGRRIALRRPKLSEIEERERILERARRDEDDEGVDVQRLEADLMRLKRRATIIPYIDPIDTRYRRYERVPRPNTEAVMFCLMDVSGSMSEVMKDLAKRFFMLLHVFLTRRYERVDVVFIRHTSVAKEVSEEDFFYSRETGGTVVSSGLAKIIEIAKTRYPTDRWNIYGAQASDGDNHGVDGANCAVLMGDLLPLCQYYAYIEVGDGMGGGLSGLSRDSDLWRTYKEIAPAHPHFAMRRVGAPAEIFSVFHELFAKGGARAA